ncbi:hypothetical protein CFOL_v3_19536, partial [Cephalotus follicularis]
SYTSKLPTIRKLHTINFSYGATTFKVTSNIILIRVVRNASNINFCSDLLVHFTSFTILLSLNSSLLLTTTVLCLTLSLFLLLLLVHIFLFIFLLLLCFLILFYFLRNFITTTTITCYFSFFYIFFNVIISLPLLLLLLLFAIATTITCCFSLFYNFINANNFIAATTLVVVVDCV